MMKMMLASARPDRMLPLRHAVVRYAQLSAVALLSMTFAFPAAAERSGRGAAPVETAQMPPSADPRGSQHLTWRGAAVEGEAYALTDETFRWVAVSAGQQFESNTQIETRADSNVLLFNVHISSSTEEPVLYPDGAERLPDDFARQLFEMSSVLPPDFRAKFQHEDYDVGAESRAFVFNAGIMEVIQCLDIGTQLKLQH